VCGGCAETHVGRARGDPGLAGAGSCHALGVYHIRMASPDDAAALLALQHRLDAQSRFMLLEPGEREQAPDRLRARLLAQSRAGSFDLIAEEEKSGHVVGWL
jgi:hypothetical protein